VPPALLRFPGDVLVLEPRRIAARMAARRVAEEHGEDVGETVGYQVRFEEVAGPKTRLRFLTEGVLTRRLLADPGLQSVGTVVLDEFHERHLEGDMALALLRRLQLKWRPELRIVVMSATLSAGPVSEYLECNVVRSEGRMFDVDIRYQPHDDIPRALEGIAKADGDVLVFLPGAAEIRRAMRDCEGIARRLGLTVVPLHGDLSPEEQDRAVRPAERPKLILSTNVAESSITIDGVTTVIDSGLARIASDSASTGLPTLEIRKISKASAMQRAGRAGRTRPGRAIRLYSPEDFHRRRDYDSPEIHRRELSQLVLELRAMQVRDVPWLDEPPAGAWAAAEELLDRLGARDHAAAMAKLPLHPRLARMIVEAGRRNVATEACRIAAMLSAGERLEDVDLLTHATREPSPKVSQIERQVRRIVRPRADTGSDDDIRIAVLTGWPDRVARRRSGRDVQLSNGSAARLAGDWSAGDLLVAVDIEDRRESSAPLVRLASAVQPEWLLDLYPDRVAEKNEVVWNRTAERVEAISALTYDNVVIEESRGGVPDPAAAGRMLAQKAVEAGLHRFADREAVDAFLGRVAFAAEHCPDIQPLGPSDVEETLAELSQGLRSFADLKAAAWDGGLLTALRARAPDRLLNEFAPERISLRGRQVRVN
jgi:ATP-dependent helicase HrpB